MFSLLFALMGAHPAAASETIVDIPPTPHRAPAGTPLPDIAASIKQAAKDRTWVITDEDPGVLTADLLVRYKHRAIVRIGYDDLNYWIEYLDSENLDYSEKDRRRHTRPGRSAEVIKGPRIHKNYNRWVRYLAKAIEFRTGNPPRALVTNENTGREPVFVADEIEKLDALRKRGVLTQKEFEHQKAKLLAR